MRRVIFDRRTTPQEGGLLTAHAPRPDYLPDCVFPIHPAELFYQKRWIEASAGKRLSCRRIGGRDSVSPIPSGYIQTAKARPRNGVKRESAVWSSVEMWIYLLPRHSYCAGGRFFYCPLQGRSIQPRQTFFAFSNSKSCQSGRSCGKIKDKSRDVSAYGGHGNHTNANWQEGR